MAVKFRKNVSKGSRFNQIYVPKDMENLIEVGDEVEVRLVKKPARLHYSGNLKTLSEFKENLIKDVFSFLNKISNVKYIFMVGSFLTEKVNYNDIDIILITPKRSEGFEELVYHKLIDKFNLRFHILSIEEKRFWHLLSICPLTRAMFGKFICDKPIIMSSETFIDKKHIKFLLMMPYDLLEINLSSRTFFDGLRRLVTIERFLRNKSLDIDPINQELEGLLDGNLYNKIKYNEEVEKSSIRYLRAILRSKLKIIEMLTRKLEINFL